MASHVRVGISGWTYAPWRDETPDGFVFSVKAPRFITHIRRLKEVRAPGDAMSLARLLKKTR